MTQPLSDKDYFQRRAEAEIEAAQAANHAAVVRSHYEMAGRYLDLVHNPEERQASESALPHSEIEGGTPGFHVIAASPKG